MKKRQRVLIILHLCFAFMMLAWYASYPFMGQLYQYRTKLFLFKTVMGDPELLDYVEDRGEAGEKLRRNQERFSQLDPLTKRGVEEGAALVQKGMQTPFVEKMEGVASLLFREISPFTLAWIFFSIAIGLLLLCHIQGAREAVWLLPALALAYGTENFFFASPYELADSSLYPGEQQLFEEGIGSSYESFQTSWRSYLATEWSTHGDTEEGEFFFNLARIRAFSTQPHFGATPPLNRKEPPLFLIFYLAWNLLFAYTTGSWKPFGQPSSPPSPLMVK